MLVDSDIITTNDFEVMSVDEKDFDYSEHPQWVELKAKSDKAFKELKKAEWAIRNK